MRLLTPIHRFAQPTQAEVEKWICTTPDPAYAARPSDSPYEWDQDHRDFVLRWYLPALFGPNPSKNDLKIWRIIVEAYLSGGELRSNGSTFVPDFHTLGRIKDCMGVGHDFLFELHQLGWEDAYGHTWSLLEANRMYFDFCVIAGHPDRGAIRWFGLLIASWIPWWFGREQKKLMMAPMEIRRDL